jgi:hypothetical protein
MVHSKLNEAQQTRAANPRETRLADLVVRFKMIKNKASLITVIFLLAVSNTNAVCLFGYPPAIEEELMNSQSVFIGKVVSESSIPESGKYSEGQNYDVKVQEVFKGKPPKAMQIFSENSSGRFPMVVGKTYVLFVYYDGRYQIDNCGNSGLASERREVFKTLRLLRENRDKRKK